MPKHRQSRSRLIPALDPNLMGFGDWYRRLREGLLISEASSDRIVLANPAAESMFASENLIGQPLTRFLAIPETERAFRLADGSVFEVEAWRDTGEPFTAEITLTAFEAGDPPGSFVATVIRKASACRRLEAHVRQRMRQFAAAEQLAQLGSWEWDVERDQLTWSDPLNLIVGLEPQARAMTFADFLAFFSPSDRSIVSQVFEQARGSHHPFQVDASVLRADGSISYLRISGMFGDSSRMIGVVQDITSQHRLACDLAERETQLRAIINQATDGIWIKDLEGRHVLINPAGAAIAGRTVEEVLGRTDEEIYPAEIIPQIRERDRRILATGVGETYEISIPSSNGGARTYFSIKFPYRLPDGSIHGIVVITRDITERKQLERALQVQYEELKQLDQLKTEFVNAVSHELRTPLTTIRGFVEFLEDGLGGELSSQQLAFVHEIDLAATRLTRLVNDLLDFARIQAGTFTLKRERFDLRDRIRAIASSLRPQLERAQLDLRIDANATLLLEGDPERLDQVLVNLLTNALKFTPAGGQIAVRARRQGQEVVCEVKDTGSGIAREDLPKLFQRFSQLEVGQRKGGVGLGLSISKAIIEAHGGQIGVQSTPGVGSVFWFRLPAS